LSRSTRTGCPLGDKKDNGEERLVHLTSHGVAMAAANYRLAPQAKYPAQVHDAKAAVRWLRGHGSEYGLATQRIGSGATGWCQSRCGASVNHSSW
jgi:acetyl esterase/lipase